MLRHMENEAQCTTFVMSRVGGQTKEIIFIPLAAYNRPQWQGGVSCMRTTNKAYPELYLPRQEEHVKREEQIRTRGHTTQ